MLDLLVTPISSVTSTAPWENLLPPGREALLQGLGRQLHQSLCAADQNLGHLEEQLLRGGQELFRQRLEKAAQQKADGAPPLCPHCQNKLSRVTTGHGTTIQSRFGPLRIQRARGWCRRCRKWRFPADASLGLPDSGTQSPATGAYDLTFTLFDALTDGNAVSQVITNTASYRVGAV
jgi:hypothetical protein